MTGRNNRAGTRKARITLAAAVAGCVASLWATSATAAPLDVTLDHGSLKLAGAQDPLTIIDPGTPAVLHSDTVSGDFTVTPGDFDFPAFTSHDVAGIIGLNVTVDLIPLENVTGHYDSATGALTTNPSSAKSTIVLSGALTGSCTVSPITLSLSTAKQNPFQGDPFDTTGITNGVIVDKWDTLPNPTPDNVGSTQNCIDLSAFTSGQGGIALANGVVPTYTGFPAPPAGSVTPSAPKKKKCKKGQKKVKVHGNIKCKKKKKK